MTRTRCSSFASPDLVIEKVVIAECLKLNSIWQDVNVAKEVGDVTGHTQFQAYSLHHC